MTIQEIQAELIEGRYDPYIFKLIFLAGGPGSGKTTVANQLQTENYGLKTLNIDVFYEALSKINEFQPQTVSLELQQDPRWIRSQELMQSYRRILEQGRLGVILDTTGRNRDQMEAMQYHSQSLGYDTAMIYVKSDLSTQITRQLLRPRQIVASLVKQLSGQVQQQIEVYQEMFSETFLEFNNSQTIDIDPSWTAAERQAKIQKAVRERMHDPEFLKIGAQGRSSGSKSLSSWVHRWLKQPSTHPSAQAWLTSQASQEQVQ